MADNLTPGPIEFSADEEKAQRQAGAAARTPGGAGKADDEPSWSLTPYGQALAHPRSLVSDLTDDQ